MKKRPLCQERFWHRLTKFLKEGDIVLAEQGTPFFGASTIPLPKQTTFIGQPLWGSIGFTLPALLGTQLAAPDRWNVLIIGDSSFQLTVQELSTILREQLNPIIILINNDGYTVERTIHGADKKYNDIHMWAYHRLPDLFGSQQPSLRSEGHERTIIGRSLEQSGRNNRCARFH
jgi:indolepyruvate decarboxylase